MEDNGRAARGERHMSLGQQIAAIDYLRKGEKDILAARPTRRALAEQVSSVVGQTVTVHQITRLCDAIGLTWSPRSAARGSRGKRPLILDVAQAVADLYVRFGLPVPPALMVGREPPSPGGGV